MFVHCGQTVGQIKMKLGMLVDLGPGHIVLDGDPAPLPPKGHSSHPIFGPYLLRPYGCMDQEATWYGGRPQPRGLCVRWGPSPLNFWPMFIGSRPSDHYFRSVCWFVCLFVCLFVQFFSAVFDLISIKLGHMLYVWV